MTYCFECGQPLAVPTAKFCSSCGTAVASAPITGPATQAAPPTPTAPPAQPPGISPVSPSLQPRVPPAGPIPESRQPAPRRRGRLVLLSLLVAAGLVAAFMLGSRSNESPSATGDNPTSEQGSGEPGSADAPAVGSSDPQAAEPSADGAAPSSAPGGSDAGADAMPSVVGMILQDAQDLLQAQGSYLMDQVDATGDGRLQIFDSNWKVCTQEPAAGARLSSADVVTLSTVKLDESCP
ncbi:MAG: PASTA domain-containing protein [Candidatus Nanopelagicales bacterium]